MQHLFADYLAFKRGAPNNGLRPARGLTVPYVWAGGEYWAGPSRRLNIYTSYHVAKTIPYWEAYVRFDPFLKAWLESPQAFRPPKEWPPDFPFPEHVSPRNVAEDFLPTPTKAGYPKYNSRSYQTWCFEIEGLHELSAYAHGWPISPQETLSAKAAAEALMRCEPFIVYALVVADFLPMRFSDASYFLRADRKDRLHNDPLSLSVRSTKIALPTWCDTAAALFRHCPPRTSVVGSSMSNYLFDETRKSVTKSVP